MNVSVRHPMSYLPGDNVCIYKSGDHIIMAVVLGVRMVNSTQILFDVRITKNTFKKETFSYRTFEPGKERTVSHAHIYAYTMEPLDILKEMIA